MNGNDIKIKEYRNKKLIRYAIIFLSLLTIFLESLALFKTISYIWGLIPFTISYIIKYFLNNKTLKKDNKVKENKK